MGMGTGILRIGTRASRLALTQANQVVDLVKAARPEFGTEIVTITTDGDDYRSASLSQMGTVGLFTRKIEQALLERKIDLAVHSAKDLPSQLPADLMIAAVPPRESSRDVWISTDGSGLMEIEEGKVVGTGSPRRRAQLLNVRPDLRVEHIRGNVETRLKKLRAGEFDALILAAAGLIRCGLNGAITEELDPGQFLPAPGQGALVVEIRADDKASQEIASRINHPDSYRCLSIERSLVHRMNAGCTSAMGALASIGNGQLRLEATILALDGQSKITASHTIGVSDDDSILVDSVVTQLTEQGAGLLLAKND